MNPPIVVIHGNSLDHVTDSYKRYLEGRIREHFKLVGTPLRIEMRSGKNPFDTRARTGMPRRCCGRRRQAAVITCGLDQNSSRSIS